MADFVDVIGQSIRKRGHLADGVHDIRQTVIGIVNKSEGIAVRIDFLRQEKHSRGPLVALGRENFQRTIRVEALIAAAGSSGQLRLALVFNNEYAVGGIIEGFGIAIVDNQIYRAALVCVVSSEIYFNHSKPHWSPRLEWDTEPL